jgi:hypothetical protein
LRLKACTPGKPVVVRAVMRDVMQDNAEPQELPGQETYVILQTAQYDSSGSGVWTLCIWRVEGGKYAARQFESVVAPKI